MPPQAHARTAGVHGKLYVVKLSMKPQQCGIASQNVRNAGMAKLVNLGAGMDLARGERCEGVKKEGCIKKQDTQLNVCVINMIIGGNLKYAVNNDNM